MTLKRRITNKYQKTVTPPSVQITPQAAARVGFSRFSGQGRSVQNPPARKPKKILENVRAAAAKKKAAKGLCQIKLFPCLIDSEFTATEDPN